MDNSSERSFSDRSPLVNPEEFPDWILFEDEDLLVVDKPGWLVCHPSKNGPWSSLVGAAKTYSGIEKLYLAGRLDRETSGVILFGKNAVSGKSWQKALEAREATRSYLSILEGELMATMDLETHLGKDPESPVFVKQRVTEPSRKSKPAKTSFSPLKISSGFTLAMVRTESGRKHQIRAHAQWAGFPIVGDKLYGRDENLYLDFCRAGWSEEMAERLALPRQALHAFLFGKEEDFFFAPFPSDLEKFCLDEMKIQRGDLSHALGLAGDLACD